MQSRGDVGQFLYGLERREMKGMAVVRPQLDESPGHAQASGARISRWFHVPEVPVHTPNELVYEQLPLLA